MFALLTGEGVRHIFCGECFIEHCPEVSFKAVSQSLWRWIPFNNREPACPDTVLEIVKLNRIVR